MELKLSGRKFTWANNQTNLIMSTIDRVFCTTDLDSFIPMASLQALPRLGSDHAPICWDSDINHLPISGSFKFEKWWLLREDFKGIVERSWNAPVYGHTAIERWKNKIRRLRRVCKGWSKNIEAALRNLKKDLMHEYDLLDIKSETTELSDDEKIRFKQILQEIRSIWLKEEVKARQRSEAGIF